MLKSISFDDFSRETFADIFLVGCLFMQTKCANRWDYNYGRLYFEKFEFDIFLNFRPKNV